MLESIDLSGLLRQFFTPEGLLMLGMLLLLIVLAQVLGKGKGKITTGRTAGMMEKLAATNRSLQQLRSIRQLQQFNQQPGGKKLTQAPPPHNRVTLWCGIPRYWFKGRWQGFGAQLQTLLGSSPTVWLPDAQRSILTIGSPGSGKTASVIDRAVESAFMQGIPVLLYDKKGSQMQLHTPLAARYGYQVHVFAPGEAFSGVLNPLDFLQDESDAVMAGELGKVINRNAREGDGGRSDEFFTKAGDLLAKALMQLAKTTPYPDMAMVYALLRLSNLAARIDYAVQTRRINEWVATSFNQFLSAKDAEKTISGILTTAAGTFSSFIQADLLRVFIGASTIPQRIEGRQLIVFKLDDARRTVVGPLLAAAIHLCVVANLSQPRRDPIAIFLDEIASLKLDKLPQWINEYRSNGGCFVLGIQSLNQLYDTYGEKMGAAIASACSTHILFNPGETKTAEEYAKRYGEKEVLVRNKSTSRSSGQHANYSTSWNESLQKVPLFTVDQILRFTEGQCVITSPGYRSGVEGSIPYLLKIPISNLDKRHAAESEQLWEQYVLPALQTQVTSVDPEQLMQGLYDRIQLAEQLLPLPDNAQQSNSSTQPSPDSGNRR